MSYVVSRRTNEIGIRMALGAERSNVRNLVLREIATLVAIGIVIGVPAALAGDRLVSKMLYGLHGTDPLSLAAATLILLTVALLAGGHVLRIPAPSHGTWCFVSGPGSVPNPTGPIKQGWSVLYPGARRTSRRQPDFSPAEGLSGTPA